jgi:hypothetical protein
MVKKHLGRSNRRRKSVYRRNNASLKRRNRNRASKIVHRKKKASFNKTRRRGRRRGRGRGRGRVRGSSPVTITFSTLGGVDIEGCCTITNATTIRELKWFIAERSGIPFVNIVIVSNVINAGHPLPDSLNNLISIKDSLELIVDDAATDTITFQTLDGVDIDGCCTISDYTTIEELKTLLSEKAGIPTEHIAILSNVTGVPFPNTLNNLIAIKDTLALLVDNAGTPLNLSEDHGAEEFNIMLWVLLIAPGGVGLTVDQIADVIIDRRASIILRQATNDLKVWVTESKSEIVEEVRENIYELVDDGVILKDGLEYSVNRDHPYIIRILSSSESDDED